jgi:hypothetical protein
MAWHDIFSSKSDVARELAEYETSQSPLGQAATSDEQFGELVDCAQMYLEDKHDKDTIVAYLDAFHR